jgi:hypothetical protein
LVEVDLENAEATFKNHGAIHILEEGYDLVKTQAQVESYFEQVVREFIAEAQASGATFGRPFDVFFAMQELGNIPWADRVFIVTSAVLEVTTYFPQNFP